MRAVIQRVSEAEVVVHGGSVSKIGNGLVTLLGIAKGDDETKLKKLIQKICDLRIFEDSNGKMNLSLKEVNGSHLIVSQFTLLGDLSSGKRPSFTGAETPERARVLYEKALDLSREIGINTAGGIFQADMAVRIINQGPCTFTVEV